MRRLFVLLAIVSLPVFQARAADVPLTVAERSGYRATSRYRDVVGFCRQLAGSSPRVWLGELGRSHEGRSLPLLVVADPPVTSAEEARRSGKLVVLLFGNIHAGEVCGKEALLMLARELATGSDSARSLLERLVLAIVPIYNADGNEKVSRDNRPNQRGPEEGMGERRNAQAFDLNRDWVKLEAPETRAMLRFYRRWDPAVIIDTHTTNGSRHRNHLTWAGPKHPAGDAKVIELVRDSLLPEVSAELRTAKGDRWETFVYGNFAARDADGVPARWETYPTLPRYGTPYRGLRNRVAVLTEAHAYVTFRERVLVTRDFVRACLERVAARHDEVRGVLRRADAARPEEIVLRARPAAAPDKATVPGLKEVVRDGKRVPTTEHRDYVVELVDRYEAAGGVKRPQGYIVPSRLRAVAENLARHGVRVNEVREDVDVDVEVYRVDELRRAGRAFEKHFLVAVEATPRNETRRIEAGSFLVRCDQALGTLAAYLLEPEAEDGLCAWNFLDAELAAGKDYPILRLPIGAAAPLSVAAQLLGEERGERKPITFDALYRDSAAPSFGGSPLRGLRWLHDGEHYLQARRGRLLKVHATSGKATLFFDPDVVAAALEKIPALDASTAKRIASRTSPRMNEARTAMLIDHENDLYHVALDGSSAQRLTSSPEDEELASFSPDGRFVAFVREYDLWVVDVQTATQRRLTTGGTDILRHGKNDWVYFEEVFGRDWKAYWWSPDSRHLAFLEIDSSPVKEFTLVDDLPNRQRVERSPYPKPGEPNPRVRLGVVGVAGGEPRWADLSAYDEADVLVTGVGWWPSGARLWFYAQNRVQTWLDVSSLAPRGGTPAHLFRETTQAWVDNASVPRFLKDGSFLWLSERSGWRHVYRFAAGPGSLPEPVQLTRGEWEVRSIELVNESAGSIWFTGTKDSPIAHNLYRVGLDGKGLVRLTNRPGSHGVAVSPNGKLWIDAWSSHRTPRKVALRDADGQRLRWLDTNPVKALDEYVISWPELHQIRTRDEFVMEASIVKPPGFDPARRYPVWLQTYGGPHAQTVRDSWSWRFAQDQMLAQCGIVVFRVDPRSASGKGAVSAWTCYKQLGVQELEDLRDAVAWLKEHAWIDDTRIGLSGHSYGGFLTAYAMTRSKLFAAGISGAPVTDWRDYDTIYTERYMLTPQANPEGYKKTSVVEAARNLHGRLLLLHGTIDDNVHLQNSVKLVRALQLAGKQFELMVYPGSRHGLHGKHYTRLKYEFILRALGVEPPESEAVPQRREPVPVEAIGAGAKVRRF